MKSICIAINSHFESFVRVIYALISNSAFVYFLSDMKGTFVR